MVLSMLKVAADPYPAHIRNMVVLDLVGHLKPEHYYELDDHLREEGQHAIAEAVVEVLRADAAHP